MKNIPTLRATLYLLLSLLGMLIGSLFPTPISALFHLVLVLTALLIEKRTFDGEGIPRLSASALWRMPRLWLIFPVFAFFTLGANLLSARLTLALGGSLPDMTPTLPLFLGAVLIAPVAEELLFRDFSSACSVPLGMLRRSCSPPFFLPLRTALFSRCRTRLLQDFFLPLRRRHQGGSSIRFSSTFFTIFLPSSGARSRPFPCFGRLAVLPPSPFFSSCLASIQN